MASDGGAYNSYVPVNSHNLFSFESKSRRLVCPIDNRDNNKKHRCCISIVGTASCLAFYGRLSLAPVTKIKAIAVTIAMALSPDTLDLCDPMNNHPL